MLSVEISLKHYIGKDDQLDTRGYIQTSKYDCRTKYTNDEDEISVSLKRLNYHVIVAKISGRQLNPSLTHQELSKSYGS